MLANSSRGRWAIGSLAGVLLLISGCGQSATAPRTGTAGPASPDKSTAATSSPHNYKGRDWCAEHGIPESICFACNANLGAKFKADGDWCDKHDLPESQCFACHPEHQEKFAADYKALYGEEPPPISAQDHDHDHGHKHVSDEPDHDHDKHDHDHDEKKPASEDEK